MKPTEPKEEEVQQSDWNMGSQFYQTLDEVKRTHIYAIASRNFIEATYLLSTEIDWVAGDIKDNVVKELREDIDSLINRYNKGLIREKEMMNEISEIRRTLWDAENQVGITRPKTADKTKESLVN